MAQLHAFERRKQWLSSITSSGEDESSNASTAIPAAESVGAAAPGRMADVYAVAAAIASSGTTERCAVAARLSEFSSIELFPSVAGHAATHRFAPRALKLLWRRNAATLRWRQSVRQAK